MGNQVMFFKIPVIPPYAVKIVDIEVELLLSELPQKLSVDDYSNFLKSEKYCESDHPAIQSLAKKQKGTNSEESARNIYQWVSRNIVYSGYTKNTRGALYAFESRKGDCTEYAWLFTALCRSGDIAARAVGGFICDTDCVLKPRGYHNWAEFYNDGSWKLSDSQKKVFNESQSDYIAFKILGELDDSKFSNKNGLFGCSNESVNVKMNG
jgi:transglutaminase-like putative cysteine protease